MDRNLSLVTTLLALVLGCSPARRDEPPAVEPNIDPAALPRSPVRVPSLDSAPAAEPVDRIAPPAVAYASGWMPLAGTGADRFVRAHPTFDGRGVVIAVLDTGIDPAIPGLGVTSNGAPKLLDFRDFSGEGAVPLASATPSGDTIAIGPRRLRGFGRVRALNAEGPWYVGTIAELPLGDPPAADLNGNGAVADTLALVVTRATDGWVVLADTDGDGSLADERAVRDFLVGREWFGWARRGGTPRIGVAANFADAGGEPRLGLAFDLSGHGSHVAGIAAANDLYGVEGFDGVAPGAQLLGLKISNSAQGSVSTTGAMVRAVDYAVRFAERRRLALVLNLSFGVGNEIEGGARIDRMLDSMLARHPSVVLTVSAGNDGPGLSTLGFPGSTDRAITVGATIPPAFLPAPPGGGTAEERTAYFSGRGGELAKPDLVAPGVAYSSVPRWNAGDEVKQGTSMASPQAAGLAALLLSAQAQERRPVTASLIRRALMVTARAAPDAAFIDEGRGLPDVEAAYRWLGEDHSIPEVGVRVAGSGRTAAWVERRPGAAMDSIAQFELSRADSAPAASYTLRANVPWLRPPATVRLDRASATVAVPFATGTLAAPGAYTGTVSGWAADTLAGPAFRLVVTVVVPAPVAADSVVLRSGVAVPAGGVLRSFFLADTARPFEVGVATGAGERGMAFLHEPGGMPYREGHATSTGSEASVYRVDGRDVRAGPYEVDVHPAPGRRLGATVTVYHAPFTMAAEATANSVVARLTGIARQSRAELSAEWAGVERNAVVERRGSDEHRLPFVVPAWASAAVVDVTMDPAQWGRFTDFGLTLFDSTGRQLGKDPLEYAFGRLAVDLPARQGEREVTVALFPGLADAADSSSWRANVSVRFYADDMIALAPADGSPAEVSLTRGASVSRRFVRGDAPWPMPEGFSPLVVLVARAGEHVWTRETLLGRAINGEQRR